MEAATIDPIAMRDGAYVLRVSQMIGGWFLYRGSDGQMHRGMVTAVELDDERGPVAIFSVGYSDGHWAPLERVARAMLARRVREHYAVLGIPQRCAAHDMYHDCPREEVLAG